jgi:hypothetical protein
MKHATEITDDLISIFTHVLTGGEANRLLAAQLVRKLGIEARRDLRATCQEIEEILDDTILAEMRERRPWKV